MPTSKRVPPQHCVGKAMFALFWFAACMTATSDLVRGGEQPVRGTETISLYSVFECEAANGKSYSNPFDFREIELRTEFTSPSGRRLTFFGFHDGDGAGGQTGNVWKFRCMPDESGTWTYRYSWTDGTSGGEGTFEATDTGLPGPLQVASDNSWYFMTSRGEPFHVRPYGMHHYLTWSQTHRLASELDGFLETVQTKVIDRGYNMIMWPDAGDRIQKGTSSADGGLPVGKGRPRRSEYAAIPPGRATGSWWHDTADTNRFSTSAFRANEQALAFCRDHGVYVLTFAGMFDQCSEYEFEELQVFLRYFVARMAPYSNYFGWSAVWEWMDIYPPAELSRIMQYVHDHDPWQRLLTAHDNSHSTFTGWLGFSMRQAPCRDVFGGNSRRAGQQQVADAHGRGGIGDPFINLPIIGSEDIWESPEADRFRGWAVPRDGTETMRAAWGIQLAGVIPLYDEWNAWTRRPPGDGLGEPYVRRMFDFVHGRTEYRRSVPLNELVSRDARQVAAGIPGEEYVVYDEDGGEVAIDLTGTASTAEFDALWFNPATGAESGGFVVRGGQRERLRSPIAGDSVLLLKVRAAPSAGGVKR